MLMMRELLTDGDFGVSENLVVDSIAFGRRVNNLPFLGLVCHGHHRYRFMKFRVKIGAVTIYDLDAILFKILD